MSILVLALPAKSQPTIGPFGGVHNAASYAWASVPGQGLAPGSIFVVKGSRFGPADILQAAPPYPPRLPDAEGGTRVTVTPVDSGIPMDTPLLYTWEWQIAGILPAGTPLGPADVTVSWQGQTSEPVRIEIMPAAPGLFTQAMSGSGPAVAQNFIAPDNQPLNSLTRPALPGQYLILWGTGLGEPNPFFGRVVKIEVELGGLLLIPSYAGPAPGHPGLDQINVPLPDDGSLPESCYTELRIRSGESVSRPVTISTASDPGACQHPLNLSPETLARLDAGGRAPVASISIQQHEFGESDGSVTARLVAATATELADRIPTLVPPDLPVGCARFDGRFAIATIRSGDFSTLPPAPDPPTPLDTGEPLLLTGPGGRSLSLLQRPNVGPPGWYTVDSPPLGFFAPGDWTLAAPGGADVGAFTVTATLPPVAQPEIPALLDRTRDYTVTWSAAGFTPQYYVAVAVSSHTQLPGEPYIQDAAVLRCIAPATDGAATFPALLLQELITPDNAGVSFSVVPAPGQPTTFTAPGIEYGRFSWSRGVYRPIAIQ